MKSLVKISAVFVATLSVSHFVVAASHVPSLEASVNALSVEDRAAFEQNSQALTGMNADVEAAVQQVRVQSAVEQGLMSAEEAKNMETALSIIEANQDKFNFDVQAAIGEAYEAGLVTQDQIVQTLQAFDSLSDSAKSLVGNEGFDAVEGNPFYDQLSDADKAIVDSVE